MLRSWNWSDVLLFGALLFGVILSGEYLAIALGLDQWGTLGLLLGFVVPVFVMYWIWEIKYKKRR